MTTLTSTAPGETDADPSPQGRQAETQPPAEARGSGPAEARRLRRWARVVLIPVGLIGAVLSFENIYGAARPTFGPFLAAGVPFLVDFLILGASLMYVAGAKIGRPRAGWRLTAHAGVAGTLVLNAMAAPDLEHLPWHVVAPAVWSVLVELSAREVLGEWRAVHAVPADRIQLALWFSAPIESARTALHMMRTGTPSAAVARREVGVNAAARRIMRKALPRGSGATRRALRRQLRAGSLDAETVVRALGWHPEQAAGGTGAVDKAAAERAALVAAVTGILPGHLVAHPQDAVDLVPVDGTRSPAAAPASDAAHAALQEELDAVRQERDALRAHAEALQAQAADVDPELHRSHVEQAAQVQQQLEQVTALADRREVEAREATEALRHLRAAADHLASTIEQAPLQALELVRRVRSTDLSLEAAAVTLGQEYGVSDRTCRRWLADARRLMERMELAQANA
jgi:hypothetical protein